MQSCQSWPFWNGSCLGDVHAQNIKHAVVFESKEMKILQCESTQVNKSPFCDINKNSMSCCRAVRALWSSRHLFYNWQVIFITSFLPIGCLSNNQFMSLELNGRQVVLTMVFRMKHSLFWSHFFTLHVKHMEETDPFCIWNGLVNLCCQFAGHFLCWDSSSHQLHLCISVYVPLSKAV